MTKPKGINHAAFELKENLINVLNISNVPSYVSVLVLKDVQQQLEAIAANDINKEKQQYEESKATEEG